MLKVRFRRIGPCGSKRLWRCFKLMLSGETRLQMSYRYVHEGRLRVERQSALIERLRQHQLPTKEAEDLLAAFHLSVADRERKLEQLLAEIDQGMRDAAGRLLPCAVPDQVLGGG